MIRIGKICKIVKGGRARVAAPITIEGKTYDLWYEVSDKYADSLCDDRSDAFVAGLIILGLKRKEDISFENPLTWQLKEGIENDFIGVICQHEPELHRVKLIGPVCNILKKTDDVVGTGASCGVDSLYAIKTRMIGKRGVRQCLLLNNMTDEDGFRQRRFERLCKNARALANEIGVELIISNSNYTSGEIPGLTAEGCTTYCNMFSALMLQGLFSQYYIAGSGIVRDFGDFYLKNGLFYDDCSNYDLLTLSAFSTASCKFVPEGMVPRVDKVKALLDWQPAVKYLDVCFRHITGDKNGTCDCPKCFLTILEILAVGGYDALDSFSEVFDVPYVRTHPDEYAAEYLRLRLHGDSYAKEIAKSLNVFSAMDYVKAFPIILRKIVGKLLRCGRVQGSSFSVKVQGSKS